MSDQVAKRIELEQSQKIADQAGTLFNTTQYEVKREKIAGGERAGWFSAATISLSFTLIGYLFSNSGAKSILAGDLTKNVPLISLLIIGWMSLLISVLASLLIRQWNALHLNYNAAFYWSSKYRESKEKTLEAMSAGLDFLFIAAENDDQAKNNIEDGKKNYGVLEKDFGNRSKFWLKTLNFAQAFVYIGAIYGITLLSAFLMIVTYRLVFF